MTMQWINAPAGSISSRVRSGRWVGTVAIVAAGLGMAGMLLASVGRFGLVNLRTTWLEIMPWIAVMAFAICVRVLPGRKSAASSFGLAVFSATFVGPLLVATLLSLRWSGESVDLGIPFIAFGDFTSNQSGTYTTVGLLLALIAGLLLVVVIWVVVARAVSLHVGEIPKSPFRVEVLSLILVLIVVALVLSSTTDIGVGDVIGDLPGPVLLLAWIVPLTLVLAFTLRSSGQGSVWAIAGLAVAFVIEPMVRALLLAVFNSFDWAEGIDGWIQPTAMAMSRGTSPTLASAWLIIPVTVLCILVLLWNAQPSPNFRSPIERSAAAPIDAWAGTAFVLSFVPLISLPAIVLGHVSYERIVADGERQRGRVLAAAAIVFGELNIASILLLSTGALGIDSNLLGRE